MIFTSLQLHNFGAYAGTQSLDLTPGNGEPLVLVGGANGAGKTTILEAFLLCLHGRRALWSSISQDAYDSFLVSHIHASATADVPGTQEAAVVLTLDYTEGGNTQEYIIRRAWRRTAAGRVKEALTILRDGVAETDVTGTMAQDFLDSLVPPALAGLFLFDGEKIQDLADNDSGEALRDAVRRLLGLDVLERLREDLWRYVASDGSSNVPNDVESAVEEAIAVQLAAQSALQDTMERQSALQENRKVLADSLAAQGERFSREGGSLAAARVGLQRKLTKAKRRADLAALELSEMAAGVLPLAICSQFAESLEQCLLQDQEIEEEIIIRSRIRAASDQLSGKLRLARRADGELVDVLEAVLLGDVDAAGVVRHDVSAGARARMLSDLETIRAQVSERASAAAKALRRALSEVQPLQLALDQAPNESTIAPMLLQMQEGGRILGQLEREIDELAEDIRGHEHQVRVADRNVRRAQERLADATGLAERAQLAARAAGVLERFEAQVGRRQLREVELETARFFNRLSRKGELIADVKIDMSTFQVSFTRWDQTPLKRSQLSAGERQLFAIAVLWALAKVSGRPLPVVIDTPLARLDRTHRANLLNEYLPEVSHQVIVLSTDTEIDTAAAELLSRHTARRYRLEYDAQSCSTTIVEGYFAVDESESRASQ